ncbi:Gfo/Idh/MocA family protein [Schleiferilactobacillus harbinensis]|uniref:Gfo/Idh/MocA family protein n=1 Tax=Schleiferilactobacillus harbinensis TaxID=304207 RepID=UPI0021A667AB|nr:Gfo/Idh/MocA family oxidoreductase [Schleiferilactobacillus harbinensis]MCT2908825.1 gfo/Idh/MocA family oxidoreductase [Schleiferilactobacillus harbinensis]
MTQYNWGMIGTGWIAHEMADALNTVNGTIYGVTDVNPDMLKKFAAEKHIQHTYATAEAMIADPNIDVIYIATPHTYHYPYIKESLNAGKHVFAEKAITVNAKQFDEVQQLARAKHLILTEGLTLMHMPLYQQVHALIAAGQLGDIHLVQVNFGSLKDYDPKNRFFNKALAGGALLDIGGYATAFARSFLASQPNVTLTTVKFFETGVDEQSGIILKNPEQQMAVMALSLRAKQPKRGVIAGTKGYIEIDNYPRATEAKVTYTADAHQTTSAVLQAGNADDALVYEVQDMQRYIDAGHDDGQLQLSHDVSHIMDDVRNAWGMKFPFD